MSNPKPIIFRSIEQYREYYFPEEVARERRQQEIVEKGWGAVAARETCERIFKKLRITSLSEREKK